MYISLVVDTVPTVIRLSLCAITPLAIRSFLGYQHSSLTRRRANYIDKEFGITNNKISKAGVEAVVLESSLGRAIESAVDAK